jgi:hypothetical protein
MNLGIIRIIGIVLFMYLSWRNLKEDYKERELISYAWIAILSFMLGGRMVYGLVNWKAMEGTVIDWLLVWQKPGISYVGGYLLMILGTWTVSQKNNWKLWSFLEDNLTGLAIMFLGFFADEFIRSGFDLKAALGFVAVFNGLAVGIWSKSRYRSLVWYQSGKKGFAFFAGNIVVWLTCFGFSFLVVESQLNRILYLVLSLISGLGLVILGGMLTVNKKRRKDAKEGREARAEVSAKTA